MHKIGCQRKTLFFKKKVRGESIYNWLRNTFEKIGIHTNDITETKFIGVCMIFLGIIFILYEFLRKDKNVNKFKTIT